jgi:hypothetical protein
LEDKAMRWNIKRKIIVNFIVVAVCLIAPKSSAAEFAGGTGEQNDPYQIATAQQLFSIASLPNLLNKHYVLVNDINLDPNLPSGRIFTRCLIAIDDSLGFSGSFDGNDHKIMNLTIHGESEDEVGLFGWITTKAVFRILALKTFISI